MARLTLPAPARRALPALAAAALLLFGAALCWRAVERGGGLLPSLTGRGRTRVTHDLVVQQVRSVAKLVTSETTIRDVVVYENTRYGFSKRALVVVTGKVLAGVDLERDVEVGIDHQARRISLTLPPARVLGVEVTDMKTYDERSSLFNRFEPEDRDAMLRRVRLQLVQASQEMGIAEHANRSAKALLERLLAADGYTVDVRFRGRPVETPRG